MFFRHAFRKDPYLLIDILKFLLVLLSGLTIYLVHAFSFQWAWTVTITVTALCVAMIYGIFQIRQQHKKLHDLARLSELTLNGNCSYSTLYKELVLHTLEKKDVPKVDYQADLLKKQAELSVLENQINPHFLYNTMDSIRGQLIKEGCTEIADTVEALSSLFRYSISKKEHLITLKQELENVSAYIKIQRYRFGSRIRFEMHVPEDSPAILQARLPKLTLQPLVENAVYHGLEEKLENGLVNISVAATKNMLIISVSDNGVGIDDDRLIKLNQKLALKEAPGNNPGNSHGIALLNVNKRLQFYFGDEYGVEVYSTKGLGTTVEVMVPYA